jgi:hypothetical protein
MIQGPPYRRHLYHIRSSGFPPNPPGTKFSPAEHWRDEIVEWRLPLARSIVATLDLPGCYRTALRLVRRLERDVPGLISRPPAECPYTIEQIVGSGGEDWFPSPQATQA